MKSRSESRRRPRAFRPKAAGLYLASDRTHQPGVPLLYRGQDDDGYRFPGVIVPVAILDDQDGPWDKNAWKTGAFYGNPPAGFNWP